VSHFRYLGSLTSEDGYSIKEIQSRIEMGKNVFMEKKKLFTGKIYLESNRIMECYMWHCGRDMHVDSDRRGLEAFEMWTWRKKEKISWLDKVINKEVLRRVHEHRQILNSLW